MLSGCQVCDWGTCAVHIEDCEHWWLSSCRGSVAERWRLKPEVSWVQLCYTFACRLPQWIYSCTKQIKIPCYYKIAYIACMERVFCVYFLPSVLCFHFPPTLSWFTSIAWIAKCEWPVLGWILILWVPPHHSASPDSQLWAPCTEHDEFLWNFY